MALNIKVVNNETYGIIDQLQKKIGNIRSDILDENWKEFFELLNNLKKSQLHKKNIAPESAFEKTKKKKQNFGSFKKWLEKNLNEQESEKEKKHSNNLLSKIDFQTDLPEGSGLFAFEDFQKNDLILEIPRNLMMTNSTALKDSEVQSLVQNEEILKSPASVQLVLALHLFSEKQKLNSFWGPYIKILPEEYGTTLTWNFEDLKILKNSPSLSFALKIIRTCIMQYLYLWNVFKKKHYNYFKIEFFTLENWIWCLSTVFSRQNEIPIIGTQKKELALIPVWDIINHKNYKEITTDFDEKKDALLFFSPENFKKGNQIFMFYGKRPNREFLIYQGFVIPNNFFDNVPLDLLLEKSTESVFEKKSQLLVLKGYNHTSVTFLLDEKSLKKNENFKFLKILALQIEEEDSIEILEKKLNDKKVEENAKIVLKENVKKLLEKYESEEELKKKKKESRDPKHKFFYLFLQKERALLENFLEEKEEGNLNENNNSDNNNNNSEQKKKKKKKKKKN